jgi:hypothetical protein
VAKSVLRQFDVAKKTADDPPDLNEAFDALALLAEELEDSGIPADNEVEDDGDGADNNNNDNDGLGDERGGMSEEDMAELEQSLIPVRLMLTKVDDIM